jgi:hypothetical protein
VLLLQARVVKLKRPLYDRLKEMGEFFSVVLWPLLKEQKVLWLLLMALCLILLVCCITHCGRSRSSPRVRVRVHALHLPTVMIVS